MNFKTNLFIGKALSYNFERFIEQYLDDGLSDTQFRELCLAQIDEIIEMHLEIVSLQEKIYDLMTKRFKKITSRM